MPTISMMSNTSPSRQILRHPLRFTLHILRRYLDNQGLLLASAVAYNTLLSLIPMLALIAITLSALIDRELLLRIVRDYLGFFVPGYADLVSAQLDWFLQKATATSFLGLAVLLFFSTFAFSVLENAFAVIFGRHAQRRLWVSLLIPYIFVLTLGVMMMLLSGLTFALDLLQAGALGQGESWRWLPDNHATTRVLGIAAEVLLFSAIYYVMPRTRIPLRHALIGGIAAALLWELMRGLLVWYFANLSMVGLIYGALATVIIMILSLEIGATIMLLGAEVIAEYARLLSGESDLELEQGALRAGMVAPSFSLSDPDGKLHRSDDYRDQWLVLYFYPRDETPGCTIQACGLRDEFQAFTNLNATILGISMDDPSRHRAFAHNHQLPFTLLSDTDAHVARDYGTYGPLARLGLLRRRSFLIDPSGHIYRIYKHIRPSTHAARLLADLKTAQQATA